MEISSRYVYHLAGGNYILYILSLSVRCATLSTDFVRSTHYTDENVHVAVWLLHVGRDAKLKYFIEMLPEKVATYLIERSFFKKKPNVMC
jgi:hypothetical protein